MKLLKKEIVHFPLVDESITKRLILDINKNTMFLAKPVSEGIELVYESDDSDKDDQDGVEQHKKTLQDILNTYSDYLTNEYEITLDIDNQGFKKANREGIVLMKGDPKVVIGVSEKNYANVVRRLVTEGFKILTVDRKQLVEGRMIQVHLYDSSYLNDLVPYVLKQLDKIQNSNINRLDTDTDKEVEKINLDDVRYEVKNYLEDKQDDIANELSVMIMEQLQKNQDYWIV